MRKTCLDSIYELALIDDRVVFIGSDLGPGVLDKFKSKFPDRFFMEGVSEQYIIGMSAGMAMEGFIPYVNTISTFLTRRCFEQNVLDLGLHKANVRLVGNGGGLVYAPLGPTHLAIEDIAIMRTIPNMTIIAPADAEEMKRLMPLTIDHQGPIYIRLAKGHDPIVTDPEKTFEIGSAILYGHPAEIILITTGITLGIAQNVVNELRKSNVASAILHMPTIKPFDENSFLQVARSADMIISVEEHIVTGGLGSACAEVLLEKGTGKAKKFKRIGIPDIFPSGYGRQIDMMSRLNITESHILSIISENLC